MEYQPFLRKRRELMAASIRDAYKKLAGGSDEADKTQVALKIEDLIGEREGKTIEFKSTLRTNLHTGETDGKMELAVLKTIAAFLNMSGGTLVVGVSDDGEPVGLSADKFANEDKMDLHLVNLIRDRIGPMSMLYVSPRFDDYQDARVMVVDCQPSQAPVYVKDGNSERFYVRTGAATTELSPSQTQQFIKQRFKA
jgi:predicted HTH transcriptional regulator